MLDIDIAFYIFYGFQVCFLVGFLPVGLAGAWHIMKMI